MLFGATRNLEARLCLAAAALLAAYYSAAPAQTSSGDIEIKIADDTHVGLAGHVRPGTWTGVKVTLRNRAARPRTVSCEWRLSDFDGDAPHMVRRVTLTPGIEQTLWLYAPLPVDTSPRSEWQFQVADYENDRRGKVIATQAHLINAAKLVSRSERAVGLISSARMGLEAYEEIDLQHEATRFIAGLGPWQLPDRWYGLSMLDALIWARDGDGPDSSQVRTSSLDAVRRWIERGGHLVIVMSPVEDRWSDSFLADVFDKVTMTTVFDQELPIWIGGARPPAESNFRINLRSFEAAAGVGADEVQVLFKGDRRQHNVVVALPVGQGRVTLVGVDVTDRRLGRFGASGFPDMTNEADSDEVLWGRVFGWRSFAWKPARVREARKKNQIANYRGDPVGLDDFVRPQISMQETAAPALLMAIVVFGLYWLLAGPVGFAVLRGRKMLHYSWVAFAAVTVVFTVVSWGGAMLLRPRHDRIQHFTVLDADASAGTLHARSWATLFMPHHRPVALQIEAHDDFKAANTIANIGLSAADRGTFLDTQVYEMAAANPASVRMPMRSTSRQLELDYLGPMGPRQVEAMEDWVMPSGTVRLVDGKLQGELRHDLPGELSEILMVYCPGRGEMPRARRHKDVWSAKVAWPLEWTFSKPATKREFRDELVIEPLNVNSRSAEQRIWGGLLGDLAFSRRPGLSHVDSDNQTYRQGVEAGLLTMLSFYDTLPPPDVLADVNSMQMQFQQGMGMGGHRGERTCQRRLTRSIDLTRLLAFRRLIVIGHLKDGPLPVPLKVDGRTIHSRGWTVVRWTCEVES